MPRFEVQDAQPDPGVCRGCGQRVMWARTVAGKPAILNAWEPIREDGRVFVDNVVSHWGTCPQRAQFVKPKKATVPHA